MLIYVVGALEVRVRDQSSDGPSRQNGEAITGLEKLTQELMVGGLEKVCGFVNTS